MFIVESASGMVAAQFLMLAVASHVLRVQQNEIIMHYARRRRALLAAILLMSSSGSGSDSDSADSGESMYSLLSKSSNSSTSSASSRSGKSGKKPKKQPKRAKKETPMEIKASSNKYFRVAKAQRQPSRETGKLHVKVASSLAPTSASKVHEWLYGSHWSTCEDGDMP